MTLAVHSLECSNSKRETLVLPRVKYLPVLATHCVSYFRFTLSAFITPALSGVNFWKVVELGPA